MKKDMEDVYKGAGFKPDGQSSIPETISVNKEGHAISETSTESDEDRTRQPISGKTVRSTNAEEPFEATVETLSDNNLSKGGDSAPPFTVVITLLVVFIILSVLAILYLIKRRTPARKVGGEKMKERKETRALPTSPDCPVAVARLHGVGRRSMQQDSFGVSDNLMNTASVIEKGVLAVVADGMGGLEDGDKISQQVVISMLSGFDRSEPGAPLGSLMLGLVNEANEAVNHMLSDEMKGRCGSTVVAVCIRSRMLSFVSVGDSHIYIWRRGELVKINHDHNFGAELDSKAKSGEISREEALSNPKRQALTSYIGMGELDLIDYNEVPVQLEQGDIVLLMSDGIYGTIPEPWLNDMLSVGIAKAADAMEGYIEHAGKPKQDNYTCIMIEVK